MSDNTIKVSVTGPTASGKTLIAAKIIEALSGLGVTVQQEGNHQPSTDEMSEALEAADTIIDLANPTVLVTEVNIARQVEPA